MTERLTQAEFVSRAVGIPYAWWRGDYQGCDCYGILTMYFRDVRGIELHGRPDTDKGEKLTAPSGWIGWEPCDSEQDADCFATWRDGRPHHCGVILGDGWLLHSEGSEDRPGSVRLTKLSAMQRVYGELRFYRYTGQPAHDAIAGLKP